MDSLEKSLKVAILNNFTSLIANSLAIFVCNKHESSESWGKVIDHLSIFKI